MQTLDRILKQYLCRPNKDTKIINRCQLFQEIFLPILVNMSELYKFIGEKIRELRQNFGTVALSQEDLAKKIDVQTNTISRWETATYKVSAEDLQKVAKTFCVDISVFFPETEQSKLSSGLQSLMSATSDLADEDIAELTEYARFRKARQILNASKIKKPKGNDE